MAFTDAIRGSLLAAVTRAREDLTEEFKVQLQSVYGMQPTGIALPLSALAHVDGQTFAIAEMLRERLSYLTERDGILPGQAFERLLRELAFTVVNRLAALKMAEEREIILESILNGYDSKGFRVFESLGGPALASEAFDRYRLYLECLFDDLTCELGPLFNRFHPQGLLFPRESALLSLLNILNAPELREIWSQDEAIGWIYQYFNSLEERREMRKHAPRNSRELAVRNQFFTPRYVVEFLVDNTVSRVWVQGYGASSILNSVSARMLPFPYEKGASKKDPRDFRILDPACGSGHFLLYAFDLLLVMYQEAWDTDCPARFSGTGQTIRQDFSEWANLERQVPRLIVERNLWGVDIDSRAAQIATLALWLRAQRAWSRQGLKLNQRPAITHSRIVAAAAMPDTPALLEEVASSMAIPVLGGLLKEVFLGMQKAGELGTLVRIEKEMQGLVKKAEAAWFRDSSEGAQASLFPEADPGKQLNLDFSGLGRDFWAGAEETLFKALEEWAERTGASGWRRRLFADDTGNGFAFIDLCRQRFDVVLMNPPFGEPSVGSKAYLAKAYPRSKHDLLAAFVERGLELLHPGGLLGAITSRTGFFLTTYRRWREEILLQESHPLVLVDLGAGVLDTAMVETAAYVLEKPGSGELKS